MSGQVRRSLFSIAVPAAIVGLALAASSCRRSPAGDASATSSSQCRYDVVHPEKSARTAKFLAWLKPRTKEMIDDAAQIDGRSEVYVTDIDNDGTEEYVLPVHQGSGGYLYMWVFRSAGDGWKMATDFPFAHELGAGHDYRSPLSAQSELLVRFCGKTYVNFEGSDSSPNSSPLSFVWEGGKAHVACDTPWLNYQRSVFQQLLDRKLYDEAHALLDGVQSSCKAAGDPQIWLSMESDLALAAYRMETYGDCVEHVAAAESNPAFPKAGSALRKSLSDSRALCESARTKAGTAGTTYDFSWLKDVVKKTPDAPIVSDQRFDGLLSAIVPEAIVDGQSLRNALKLSISVPNPSELIGDRYVVLSGCRPHDCDNKGFIWIDTASKKAIIMTNGQLASKTVAASDVPEEFWPQTLDLGGPVSGDTVDYVEPSGQATPLNVP